MTALTLPRGARILAPVHPNVGIEADYRRRLDRLIEELNVSLLHWLSVQWRRNPPVLAEDEAPVAGLQAEMRRLARRWQSRFDKTARALADYFAGRATRRAQGGLEEILRRSGMTVNFKLTSGAREALNATVGENVSLIKSIASEHLADVEQDVMRSVTQGRDLGYLTRQIEHRYDLTRKRAALIARDQNNKATATITRVRQQELGIRRARWLHSGAGKHPRPDHVAFSAGRLGGPFFDVERGALISGERIWPGQLINCRCVSCSVIEGLS